MKRLTNLLRYTNGFLIGMCLEYVYRFDTPIWYLPLGISVLLFALMIVDLLPDSK